MIGRTYVEQGSPVIVLIRWGKGNGPRNVLVQRLDGSRVVRPFRGLRRSRLAPADAIALRLGPASNCTPSEAAR